MTFELKWLNLQLFAGEGSGGEGGGEGATTGDTSAVDAGQQSEQRLLELGVPQEVLNRREKKRSKRTSTDTAARSTAPQKEPAQDAQQTATATTTEESTANTSRMSWDEIMADPEYNKQMQNVVQSRLRTAKAAEDNLSKITPALELLARKHNIDVENMDYEALAKAISDDNQYYEDKALAMGVSLEDAKRMDQEERNTARRQREEQQTIEQQRFQQHIERLQREGEELKKTFPTFDLRTELQNPAFARMTAPNVGISVQDAYFAVHRNEIQAAAMQVTAQKAAQKISNSIQAGQRRPDENGTSGQAPSVTTFDYRNASKEQRDSLKKRIFEAQAQGKKLYPGQ